MHLARAAAPLLGLTLALGACSSGGGATPAPTAVPTAPPSEAAGSPASSATGLSIDLASSSLGSILVDGDGRTLYAFTPDTAGTSTCTASCATTWPPLTSDSTPSAGAGVDAQGLGTTARDDGSTQITYDGRPLYYFSGDSAPGDTNGQGVAGKWYVVAADGTMVGAPAASAAGY